MYDMMDCIYSSVTPSPSPLFALLFCHGRRRRRRWRIRLTDSAGFLLVLPPSVLLAIPLSTHPCPLQRESSCVSLSVSRGAAGEPHYVPCNKHPAKFIPSPFISFTWHPFSFHSSPPISFSSFHISLQPLSSYSRPHRVHITLRSVHAIC